MYLFSFFKFLVFEAAIYANKDVYIRSMSVRVRFEPERTGTPFLFFVLRRSGPFRHIAAKFRFHLNESDKFALFGNKMPSASPP